MEQSKRILVSGINGFVGKHLATELKNRDVVVLGVGREAAIHPDIAAIVDAYYACDLTNVGDVASLPLRGIDAIINLAGFAAVGASYGQEELYMRVNVGVLTVMGERILDLGLKIHMLAISTGAVYSPDQPLPLNENSELITMGSPYALSKIAMEKEATRLRELGLNCTIARPFNHIGPGQEPGFLVPDLYKKIVSAINTNIPAEVGDLSTRRDYTDVRDVVRAYADLILSEHLDEEVYNICSGHSVSGSKIFQLLTNTIENATGIQTVVNPELIRAGDPKNLYGDNGRLNRQTGWLPRIPIEQTIQDFVEKSKE
jgi:GDP-4-dehydro-6-deoxy-D-mannose reductase